jgi:hypothetical protein
MCARDCSSRTRRAQRKMDSRSCRTSDCWATPATHGPDRSCTATRPSDPTHTKALRVADRRSSGGAIARRTRGSRRSDPFPAHRARANPPLECSFRSSISFSSPHGIPAAIIDVGEALASPAWRLPPGFARHSATRTANCGSPLASRNAPAATITSRAELRLRGLPALMPQRKGRHSHLARAPSTLRAECGGVAIEVFYGVISARTSPSTSSAILPLSALSSQQP